MKKIMSFGFLGLLIGCNSSGGSSSSGVTATAGAQAINTVVNQFNDLGSLYDGGSSRKFRNKALGDIWDTAAMPDPTWEPGCGDSPDPITLRDWMGYEFDENALRCNGSAINVFGRALSTLKVSCAVLSQNSAATSDDLPTSGTRDLVMNSANKSILASVCGFSSEELSNIPSDTTITMEFAEGNGIYDRKVHITGLEDNQYLYITYNASTIALAHSEVPDGPGYGSRSLGVYDVASDTLKFEYISQNTEPGITNYYIHRIFKQPATAGATRVYSNILTDELSQKVTTAEIEYVLTGKVDTTDDLAYGVHVQGYGLPTSTEIACVSPATGNIGSAPTVGVDSFTCGTIDGRDSVYANAGQLVISEVSGNSSWNDMSTTGAQLLFTDADNMLTTGIVP